MFGRAASSSLCVLVQKLDIFLCNLFCVVQLNALHSELANQMADSMVFPLIQFREKDLTGRTTHTSTKLITIICYKVVLNSIFLLQHPCVFHISERLYQSRKFQNKSSCEIHFLDVDLVISVITYAQFCRDKHTEGNIWHRH